MGSLENGKSKELHKMSSVQQKLNPALRKALEAAGYTKPKPIQKLPLMLARFGFDMLIRSPPNTGKTLLLCIMLLEKLARDKLNGVAGTDKAIIFVNSSARAVYAREMLSDLAEKSEQRLNIVVIDEGVAELNNTEHCGDVIIGDPHKVWQFMKNHKILIKNIRVLILMDVEDIITRQFRKLFYNFRHRLNSNCPVFVTGSRYDCDVFKTLAFRMSNAIMVSEVSIAVPGIKQFIYDAAVPKWQQIEEILLHMNYNKCVIFVKSQEQVVKCLRYLAEQKIKCLYATELISKRRYDEVFNKFTKPSHKILIATFAIREHIKVTNINLVLLADVPCSAVSYLQFSKLAAIHINSQGIAITLIHSINERVQFDNIMGELGYQMSVMHFPREAMLSGNWKCICDYDNFDVGNKCCRLVYEFEKYVDGSKRLKSSAYGPVLPTSNHEQTQRGAEAVRNSTGAIKKSTGAIRKSTVAADGYIVPNASKSFFKKSVNYAKRQKAKYRLIGCETNPQKEFSSNGQMPGTMFPYSDYDTAYVNDFPYNDYDMSYRTFHFDSLYHNSNFHGTDYYMQNNNNNVYNNTQHNDNGIVSLRDYNINEKRLPAVTILPHPTYNYNPFFHNYNNNSFNGHFIYDQNHATNNTACNIIHDVPADAYGKVDKQNYDKILLGNGRAAYGNYLINDENLKSNYNANANVYGNEIIEHDSTAYDNDTANEINNDTINLNADYSNNTRKGNDNMRNDIYEAINSMEKKEVDNAEENANNNDGDIIPNNKYESHDNINYNEYDNANDNDNNNINTNREQVECNDKLTAHEKYCKAANIDCMEYDNINVNNSVQDEHIFMPNYIYDTINSMEKKVVDDAEENSNNYDYKNGTNANNNINDNYNNNINTNREQVESNDKVAANENDGNAAYINCMEYDNINVNNRVQYEHIFVPNNDINGCDIIIMHENVNNKSDEKLNGNPGGDGNIKSNENDTEVNAIVDKNMLNIIADECNDSEAADKEKTCNSIISNNNNHKSDSNANNKYESNDNIYDNEFYNGHDNDNNNINKNCKQVKCNDKLTTNENDGKAANTNCMEYDNINDNNTVQDEHIFMPIHKINGIDNIMHEGSLKPNENSNVLNAIMDKIMLNIIADDTNDSIAAAIEAADEMNTSNGTISANLNEQTVNIDDNAADTQINLTKPNDSNYIQMICNAIELKLADKNKALENIQNANAGYDLKTVTGSSSGAEYNKESKATQTLLTMQTLSGLFSGLGLDEEENVENAEKQQPELRMEALCEQEVPKCNVFDEHLQNGYVELVKSQATMQNLIGHPYDAYGTFWTEGAEIRAVEKWKPLAGEGELSTGQASDIPYKDNDKILLQNDEINLDEVQPSEVNDNVEY